MTKLSLHCKNPFSSPPSRNALPPLTVAPFTVDLDRACLWVESGREFCLAHRCSQGLRALLIPCSLAKGREGCQGGARERPRCRGSQAAWDLRRQRNCWLDPQQRRGHPSRDRDRRCGRRVRRGHQQLSTWLQRRGEGPRRQRIRWLLAGEDLSGRRSPFAEEAPLLLQNWLELPLREAGSIAQGRGQEELPQVLAQCRQCRHVRGDCFGLLHILVVIRCNEFIEPQCCEQGDADTRTMSLPVQAHNGHSHEHRLARRRGVGIREGVQSHVNLVVDIEMIKGCRCERHQLQPVFRDAVGLELVDDDGLHVG
mmetsp:Transcript_14621/g.32008  ORF Transcript_14621/g.32008 Transcript_14621/m.32008 type:complete len:311 (-) Transcript_14621:1813-2745(-)